LRVAERALRALPARAIVRALADAAERWRDVDFPPRVCATRAIGARTGYSEPVVGYALDALFGEIERGRLSAAIAAELGSLDALDGFVQRPGGLDGWARGVERVTIVASDTTVGVAVLPAVFALCAKAQVVVKDRADDLVAAFAATLAEMEPAVGRAFVAERWGGHDDPRAHARLAAAEVVVAFGASEALAALRAQTDPEARFVPYGHRTSVGYLERAALTDERTARTLADAIARDALLYDGEGCLSLHALFVERGGNVDAGRFARILDAACAAALVKFPPASASLDPRAVGLRDAAAFRAAQRGTAAFVGGDAAAYLVLVDPPRAEPPPLVPRVIAFYAVDSPSEALAVLEVHRVPLEALALADTAPRRADLAAFVAGCGATRVAPFGRLQHPPLDGLHGGEGRILPFVRWRYRER
jgi:hypothetical protein